MKRNEGIVMKSKALGLLAAALVGVSGGAGAAAVLVGTTTDPTGIDGLVVDGTNYNVAFSTTTYNTFNYGTVLSADSAKALAAALFTFGVTAFEGAPPGSGVSGYEVTVDNPDNAYSDYALFRLDEPPGSGYPWGNGITFTGFLGNLGDGVYIAAADFTPAPVPVPASIWLILSGLAGLGLAGWRRGQTASV
jgi:hypothetical protein